jgi:hypothetical protein
MSFICDVCKKTQPNRVKPIRIVTETRGRIYEPVLKPDKTIDRIPEGWEIVKEISCCLPCSQSK